MPTCLSLSADDTTLRTVPTCIDSSSERTRLAPLALPKCHTLGSPQQFHLCSMFTSLQVRIWIPVSRQWVFGTHVGPGTAFLDITSRMPATFSWVGYPCFFSRVVLGLLRGLIHITLWSYPYHYFMEHRRRLSSHDVSQPSKLAFSCDVKCRLNVEQSSHMSAFRILSLLLTPLIRRTTFTSAALNCYPRCVSIEQYGLSMVLYITSFDLRGTFRCFSNRYHSNVYCSHRQPALWQLLLRSG